MTPGLARALVIGAAAVAVVVAAVDRGGTSSATERELSLLYVYSPDAEELLEPLLERYNRESHRSGGREVAVRGTDLTSGEAEAAISARDLHAVLWTPASSRWGQLLNHAVGAEWAPASPTLVLSPQVIAMWKPLAEALGWPRAEIGWKDILALARSSRGWAAYGRPEYGEFRLGHTNPEFSTSGLNAVASEYYAVTGKRRGLTLADVRRPDVRAAVRAIERSIVHYGETASAITDQMNRYGEAYVHAVYVQETTVRKFNEKRKRPTPLVAIRPADGTFVADYPLIALSAPWVDADERAAALAFGRWLRRNITAKAAAAHGFHLRRPPGLVELELPEPAVLDAIRDAWHEDRKPANVVLVVDTSSSMSEDARLDAAKQGLLSFVKELSREDRVGLVTSGASVRTNVPLGSPAASRAAVSRAVQGLFATGDAPVYPAVERALRALRARGDADRINAIVVLSDGAGRSVGRDELLRTIAAEPVTEGTQVRIFTVAYGKGAHTAGLRTVARASGGRFFPGSPSNIKDVYRKISSYF